MATLADGTPVLIGDKVAVYSNNRYEIVKELKLVKGEWWLGVNCDREPFLTWFYADNNETFYNPKVHRYVKS